MHEENLIRRSFLKLAAVPATLSVFDGNTARAESTTNMTDPYYADLESKLSEMGLPSGSFLVSDSERETMELFGENLWGAASLSVHEASDTQPFSTYLRVTNHESSANFWEIGFNSGFDKSVTAGEVLLGVAYMRCPEGAGSATVDVFFKQNDGYENHVKRTSKVSPGSEWTCYYFPVEYDESSNSNDAWVDFFLGFGQQVIDIGGIAVISFADTDVRVDELPGIWSYQGRSPSAAWREDAHERIETHRKGDLTVTVCADDDPVSNAEVSVSMTEHTFGFGTVVNAWRAADDTTAAETYREKFLQYFNKASIENGLKWIGWEDTHHREATLETLDWLSANGVPVRGHTLLWPDFENSPDWVYDLADDPEALHQAIADHIRDEAGTLSGRLTAWDVINEPHGSHAITDILGKQSLCDWFEITSATDPDPSLIVNDWGMLYEGMGDKRDWYESLIGYFQSNGTPIDGIGMQAHFSMHNTTRPSKIIEIIDRFATHDLDVEITEWDFRVDDPTSEAQLQLQADYTRDLLTAAFSHPATTSIVGWGFWESQMYHSSGAYFRDDWSIKPNGQAYLDLVYDEWWTHETGTTDTDGSFSTRGFLGDYEITVTTGETAKTIETKLTDGENHVTIDLDPTTSSVSLSTHEATDITDSTVTLNGELVDLGDTDTIECFFEYREAGTDTWFSTSPQSLSAPQSFSADLVSVDPGTHYEYRAVGRTETDNPIVSESVQFTTEDGQPGGNAPPEIKRYSVTEAGSPNPHAEISVTWDVADPDGDLDSVTIEVVDSATNTLVDGSSHGITGSSASGTDRFKRKHARNQTFDVRLTVTDAAGNSATRTNSVTE